MHKGLLYLSIFSFVLIGCGEANKQRDEFVSSSHISMKKIDWKKSYSNDRMSNLVTMGNDGNFYSATTLHMGSDSPSLKLFKTSSRGEELWSRRVRLDIGEDKVLSLSFSGKIGLDNSDNILIAGTSQSISKEIGSDGKEHTNYLTDTHKAFLVKTDNDGNKQWEYIYQGAEIQSYGKSFDVDSQGNYYFCGIDVDKKSNKRTFVVKLSPNGDEEYIKYFSFGGDMISHNEIIISGNELYILGNSSHKVVNGNIIRYAHDIGVLKATLEGNVIWEKSYKDGNNSFRIGGFIEDYNKDIIIASSKGDVDYSKTESKINLLKLNSNGEKLWSQDFGTDKDDNVLDIEVDSENNIFVSGWTRGAFSGFTNEHARDPYIAKFSKDGTLVKIDQFDAPEGSTGNAITIDSSDHVYLSGYGKLTGENKYTYMIRYK